ncbi:DUF6492 family protein [Defluviicoccus vanus]|uniref:Glycosyl transferase n=1 Tax=Defluviicoccus vanus TaxID=111831 RepID=A0A7H1MX88_9PROT|nr:DUF6492 family protein [Defluviicoccus vanus]QNT68074.1 hypothetical protein HQ394_00175 [Defluviicoccus vanus]
MSTLSYALVTPSYWKDVERCAMLIESVDRWVPPEIRHYLVIARRDVPLFRPLLTSRCQLIVVEDIIPAWLFRVPGIRRFWMSLRTRPVKNWILQQIVKLSVPGVVSEDVLLYADSDMFFIQPYDPRNYERGDRVPLFAETGQRGLITSNDLWQAVGSCLLGLPVETDCDSNYVGQLVYWRRANAVDMVRRVEEVNGHSWQQEVASRSDFAEYILYGLYATRVLGERSGHWHDDLVRTLCYWPAVPLDRPALERFRGTRQPHHHSAMVSSKSGTPVADIRAVFFTP